MATTAASPPSGWMHTIGLPAAGGGAQWAWRDGDGTGALSVGGVVDRRTGAAVTPSTTRDPSDGSTTDGNTTDDTTGEPECNTNNDCPIGEVCTAFGNCRRECADDSDCFGLDTCIVGYCGGL